jgi:WD40 repeat protein
MSLDGRLRDGLARSSGGIVGEDVEAAFASVVRGARRRRLVRRVVAAGMALAAAATLIVGIAFLDDLDRSGDLTPSVLAPDARSFTIDGHGIRFSEDGTRLFAQGDGPIGRVFDALTGEPLGAVEGARGNQLVDFSPDGSLFVTVRGGGSVGAFDTYVNDTSTGRELWDFRKACCFVAFSPDGRLLALPRAGRTRVVDLTTGATVKEFDAFGYVVFSPDGERLAVTSNERGTLVEVFDLARANTEPILALRGDNDGDSFLTKLAWSPGGRTLVTATGDGSAKFWDAATGAKRFEIRTASGRFTSLAFGSSPLELATGTSDGTASVWLLSEGLGRPTFNVHIDISGDEWLQVALSPDGSRLMTTSTLNETTVWNLR